MSTAGTLGVGWRQFDTSAEIHGAMKRTAGSADKLIHFIKSKALPEQMTTQSDLSFRVKPRLWINSEIRSTRSSAVLVADVQTRSDKVGESDGKAVTSLCRATAVTSSWSAAEELVYALSHKFGLGIASSADAQPHCGGQADVSDIASHDLDAFQVGQDVVEHWLAFDDLHANLQEHLLPLPELPGTQEIGAHSHLMTGLVSAVLHTRYALIISTEECHLPIVSVRFGKHN